MIFEVIVVILLIIDIILTYHAMNYIDYLLTHKPF